MAGGQGHDRADSRHRHSQRRASAETQAVRHSSRHSRPIALAIYGSSQCSDTYSRTLAPAHHPQTAPLSRRMLRRGAMTAPPPSATPQFALGTAECLRATAQGDLRPGTPPSIPSSLSMGRWNLDLPPDASVPLPYPTTLPRPPRLSAPPSGTLPAWDPFLPRCHPSTQRRCTWVLSPSACPLRPAASISTGPAPSPGACVLRQPLPCAWQSLTSPYRDATTPHPACWDLQPGVWKSPPAVSSTPPVSIPSFHSILLHFLNHFHPTLPPPVPPPPPPHSQTSPPPGPAGHSVTHSRWPGLLSLTSRAWACIARPEPP